MAHVLNYPQKPIVQTKTSKLVNADTMPSGVNAIVAIMCMTGFNQEDSIIMNKSAIDRGLFSSTYYRTYKDQNNRNHSNGEEEFFIKPEPEKTVGMKPFNYDKLAIEGFVPENTAVDAGDVIIGKCMPQKRDSVIVYKDTSISLKNNESGHIDKNCYGDKHFTNVNGDGYTFSKVRIRNMRMPTIGDKFSCYAPDHEVLTRDHGWVRFDALTLAHWVATLVDGALVYQQPTEVQVYDGCRDQTMYAIKNENVDLLVTPNHRMYVRDMETHPRPPSMRRRFWGAGARSSRLLSGLGGLGGLGGLSGLPAAPTTHTPAFTTELAEEVFGKSKHYKRDVDAWAPSALDDACYHRAAEHFVFGESQGRGDASARAITHFKLDGHLFPIEAWIDAVGAWISTSPTNTTTTTGVTTPTKVCDLCGGPDEDPDNARLHAFATYVKRFPDALPPWVVALDRPLTRRLLAAVLHVPLDDLLAATADASDAPPMTLDTASIALRDQFQQLCLHAGYAATWTLLGSAYYRCTLLAGRANNEPLVNRSSDERREAWVRYGEDKVYCCTVPAGEGVVYVRRGGLPVWCGQSKHGQKGTVGMVYRQEDMPYTKDGLVPDLIINPHAIPSRMTIAQLMECLLSKSCIWSGTYGDATPFTDVTVEGIADALERHGCDRLGNEVLYNPRTGEQIDTDIFIGPTLYQRLKHMTCDKVHSRSNAGPIVLLTRQPAEGRAREGGLRIGEMEQETNIGHGITSFLKERFMESSDNYRVFVCKRCGSMANVNPDKNIFSCKPCKNTTHFAEIRIPYAAKLLFQEMNCMAVSTRFVTG